jgi:hypothetical protein
LIPILTYLLLPDTSLDDSISNLPLPIEPLAVEDDIDNMIAKSSKQGTDGSEMDVDSDSVTVCHATGIMIYNNLTAFHRL